MRISAALICLLSISWSVVATASESPVGVRSELVQRLIDFSSDLTGWNDRQVLACKDYRDGEIRRLQSPHGFYFITKTGKQSYLAQINIRFVPTEKVSLEQVASFREKVKACYQRAQGLKDTEGKELRFELLEPGQAQFARLQPIDISVHPTDRRENSRNYYLKTNCPTILHEAFHLLGLKDEYEEKEQDMSCRSLGDSIMSTQASVYISGLLWQEDAILYNNQENLFRLVEGIACRDSTGRNRNEFHFHAERKQFHLWNYSGPQWASTKLLDERIDLYIPAKDVSAKGKLALSENTKKLLQLESSLKWSCEVVLKPRSGSGHKTGAEILASRSKLPPLRPAHFRKILNPKCRQKNQVYDFCSWETYLVRPSGHQCLKEQYSACSNGDWLK